MTIKVLNLYAGIGGNRKLWEDVDVTAVELDLNTADIYCDNFPEDKIVLLDAHQYLIEHYKEYDFIWSSPPCQSHSSFRFNIGVRFRNVKPQYPDMRLYQEVVFLQNHFKGKWVVENVQPYYNSLIKPTIKLQRHLFWSNFHIEDIKIEDDIIREAQIPQLQRQTGFDLAKYNIPNKRQVLRNCVNPKLGLHILNCALKHKQGSLELIDATPENISKILREEEK